MPRVIGGPAASPNSTGACSTTARGWIQSQCCALFSQIGLRPRGDGTGPRTMAGTDARACCAALTRRQRGASGQRRSSSCSVRKRPCRRRPALRRGSQINGCRLGSQNTTSRNAPRINRYRQMADGSARHRATGNNVFGASASRNRPRMRGLNRSPL